MTNNNSIIGISLLTCTCMCSVLPRIFRVVVGFYIAYYWEVVKSSERWLFPTSVARTLYVYMCLCSMYMYMYVYLCTCTCTYTCIYVHIHVRVSIYMYSFISLFCKHRFSNQIMKYLMINMRMIPVGVKLFSSLIFLIFQRYRIHELVNQLLSEICLGK